MNQANEDLLRHFVSLWASRDAAGMEACFAEDGVYDNVPDEKPMAGRKAIREWLDACFGVLTRIDVDILNISSNGEWVLNERLDDHIIGDKHLVVPVMNATRIVDGKIVMFRDYYCRQTVKELGFPTDGA
jgi:limonene-1,2-epoxide hydrolase